MSLPSESSFMANPNRLGNNFKIKPRKMSIRDARKFSTIGETSLGQNSMISTKRDYCVLGPNYFQNKSQVSYKSVKDYIEQSRRWLVTMGPWWVLFIFCGAGVEKNCKVNPVTFHFLGVLSLSLFTF